MAKAKAQTKRVIRTLDDFLAVPADEIAACARAFGEHVDAVRQLPSSLRTISAFVWAPVAPIVLVVTADTAIDSLGLDVAVRDALHEEAVYFVDDLAEMTEARLLRNGEIDGRSVAVLRAAMTTAGMMFKVDPDDHAARYERSRRAQDIRMSARGAGLTPDCDVCDLGLSRRILVRLSIAGIRTIDALQDMSLRDFETRFTNNQRHALYTTMAAVGFPWKQKLTLTERWRLGLIYLHDLPVPSSEDTRVADLHPWLGKAVPALERHGVVTLADMRRVAAADFVDLPGLRPEHRVWISRFVCAHRP